MICFHNRFRFMYLDFKFFAILLLYMSLYYKKYRDYKNRYVRLKTDDPKWNEERKRKVFGMCIMSIPMESMSKKKRISV